MSTFLISSFDDLFFVGQVFVKSAVALDVGLRLQQRQRFLHLLGQGRQVQAEAVIDEDGQIACGGLKAVDVFDEEQRLKQADGKRVIQVAFGDVDGALGSGLQRRPDAGEHVVEGGQPTDFDIADVLGDLLHHTEH